MDISSDRPPSSSAPNCRSRRCRICGGLAVTALVIALLLGALALADVFSSRRVSDSELMRSLYDLDQRMEGRVILPAQRDFSNACVVWNQVSSLHLPPRAVIEVASEDDVRLAIQVLATLDVPFAIRSGGHSKAGYSNSPDGIIVSLGRLNHIQVQVSSDPDVGAVAKLGPGIKGPGVLNATMPKGYAGVLGLCPTVAEGGFILGGGLGLMSRKHGLGLDNLLSANVVLASSDVVTANSTHNPDLFWALRGAGIGNFGVVTEMTYQLHRSQEAILVGVLSMPVSEAPTFLHWIAAKEPPRELSMIMETEGAPNSHFNHLFNHSIRGLATFALMWACEEPACLDVGKTYIHEELRTSVAGTELVLHDSMTWLDNPMYHGKTSYTDLIEAFTGFLHPENATTRTLQTIVETYRNWTTEMAPYVTADLELWGGKISDIPAEATAFPHRGAVFNLGLVVSVPKDKPDVFQSIHRRLSVEWHVIGQFLNGSYVNYQMASLSSDDYLQAYWGPHVQRLQKIKSRYDPGNLFKYPQGIPVEKSGNKNYY